MINRANRLGNHGSGPAPGDFKHNLGPVQIANSRNHTLHQRRLVGRHALASMCATPERERKKWY